MTTLNELENDPLIFALSIDGTHCPIEEQRPFSNKWFSQKLGCSGVNYEIALKINKSQLVWVNGPFPAGELNDIKTFREKGLKEQLPAGKKIIGDKGYRGEREFISTQNNLDPREIAEFKERVSARHESFNSRLKHFNCLTKKFRHGFQLHGIFFRACCTLILYEFEHADSCLYNPYP